MPVAGTYAPTEAHPQGITAVLLAPIDGLYNHETYTAGAIDVALFVLIIGGFLGVVNKTGAIDAGIERVTVRLNGKEEWMIPILMGLSPPAVRFTGWRKSRYLLHAARPGNDGGPL